MRVRIGKTELQPEELFKGRWPAIVSAPVPALADLQHFWTKLLPQLLPWVKKSWDDVGASTPELQLLLSA